MVAKPSKFKQSDVQAVKSLDPNLRDALNKILTKLNSERSNSNANDDFPSSSRNVQSLYPKCKFFLL